MNKIFKFMPVALGMLALASCSQDDFEGNDVVQLKSNQILATVEVAYDENGNPTRNGMGEFGSEYQFVWQTGDEAKLYAARNWKTDVWTVVETADKHTKGVFESTNRVAVTDMAYGLYPADGTLVNEDRSELSVELPSLIVYDKLFDATYGEQTGNAYACQRPLFGFAVDQDLKFRYLTSVLRLKIQNGLPAGAKYVVVRSSENADKLSGTFTADIKQISEEFFEDNTKGATYEIPTLVGDATAANWVCVDLTKATNYDNNIYIPIPAQVYTGELSVYLCNSSFNPATYTGAAEPGNGVAATFYLNGKTADDATNVAAGNALRTYDVAKEFSRTTVYTIGTIVGPATLSCDAKTFIDVNEYLATLKPDRDLTITFPNMVNSFVKTVWGVKLESNTLEIPASWNDTEHTVTLQFAGVTQSINTSQDVADLDGVALTGASDLKTLEISNKGTMKNVIINATEAGNDITVDVKESAGQITLGDNIKEITLTSGNVAIGKEGGVNTGVTIADNGATSLTINSGTIASLTPKSNAVTINGGTVTALQLTDRNFAITMTGGNLVKIAKPTAVSTVERTVTVATEGAAVIETVEEQANLKYVFTAKYTDATHGTSATAQEKIYTAAQFIAATGATPTTYTLYTDIEIANKTASKNIEPLALNAAVTKFDGQGHKISNLYAPLFGTLASTADGGLTIQNLVIENPTIATASNVGTVTASVTKSATLKNIAVTGAKIGADYGTVDANSAAATVGGLVGSFAGSGQTLTITDCSVAGTVQGYYNVGGFIGLVNEGTVNITKTADVVTAGTYMSNVTLKKNYWKSDANDSNCGKVGNFIGSITAATALTIGDAGGTGNPGANAFNKFFSANSVNATTIAIAEQADANKGYLEFARNISRTKKYQGSENQLVGYSTAAPGTTTIFGQTKAKAGKLDATGETITTANYFNYSK